MKRISVLCLAILLCIGMLAGCASEEAPVSSGTNSSEASQSASEPQQSAEESEGTSEETPTESRDTSTGTPTVYMTTDISAEGLIAIYEALHASPSGNITVKFSTGEPGSNYLCTDLIDDLVQSFDNPTIVECNTVYSGQQANTAMHYQLAEDYGYTAIADVDIMDENGSMTLPVTGGSMWGGDQDAFLESMAEAGKYVVDYLDGNILYINVMNRLSVDCDCDGNPAELDMHDIGILASFDPVAVDQACIDLVYVAEDGDSLVQRIESRNGLYTLEHAEDIGLGSRTYELVSIDE